jgi:hypothetical protein
MIETVKEKYDGDRLSAADFPISDLNIYTKNFRIVYEPKQDITPYELSRLTQLFFVLTTINLYGSLKIEEFLQEHNLERHFSYHPRNA